MNVTIVIPSYKPDGRFAGYVESLASRGFKSIVVVDDGSGAQYQGIFDELRTKSFCHVLKHDVNRGKGAALRTGFAYVLQHIENCVGIVTADSDGQHSVEDCVRIADELARGGTSALLGSRDFSIGKVPFRSWIGNRWTSLIFALVFGRWLSDTQTGLRAFPISVVRVLMTVAGDRYEYEMGCLIAIARADVPIKPLSIRTIYENGNSCSHFNPIIDAIRIYRLILADFLRFAGVSIASFVLDQGLAWGFAVLLDKLHVTMTGVIWMSGFAARIMSSVFNFSLNRTFVFKSKCEIGPSAWKYALLCVVVIILSNVGVTALSFVAVPRGIGKFVCDVLLYFMGYRIQSKLIFRK
jgi:dolichol-phosphate mannosyltransferase